MPRGPCTRSACMTTTYYTREEHVDAPCIYTYHLSSAEPSALHRSPSPLVRFTGGAGAYMVSMAAAKLAALLAMAAVFFAVAGAANPQEAHCWQCYYSCMQQKCGGYRNPAAHTAVDDGAAAASVPLNSTDGGAAAHVAGGYESYCKCNKACIVECYKALPPVCYQMCVSETCSKLPPCKQAECYKACREKCYHKQPSPGPKPPSPKPNPGPKPTPPKPAPPNHGGSPKPTPPNHGGSPKPKPPKPTPPNHGGSPKPKPPRPTPPKRPCPPHAPKPKPKPCPPKAKPKPPCPCPPAADVSASTNNSNN